MNLYFYILYVFLLMGCDSEQEKTIRINVAQVLKDSCLTLKDKEGIKVIEASRKMEIMENTLTDTTLFGYGILLPGDLRVIEYSRVGEGIIDPDIPLSDWPKTSTICFTPLRGKRNSGYITIKYRY